MQTIKEILDIFRTVTAEIKDFVHIDFYESTTGPFPYVKFIIEFGKGGFEHTITLSQKDFTEEEAKLIIKQSMEQLVSQCLGLKSLETFKLVGENK